MHLPIFASIVSAFISNKLIALALAAIPVGAISFALYQVVKRFSTTIDDIPNAWTHRAVVAGVSFALTAVFTVLNVPIVCSEAVNCLAELDQEKIELVVKAVLGAVSAFVLHSVKNGRK